MRKLKQIAIALLMALMTCACVLGLSACEGQYVGDRDQLHEHTMVYHAQVDASCTKDGAEEYWQCTECKKIFSDAAGTTVIEAPEKLTASGHTWGDWIVVKEASCKGPGSETRTCSCGATQTQDISALDHTWGNQVTEGATCTEASKTTYTCSVCGDTKVEKGEALGHNFTKVDKVEATCTEPGNVEYYACSVCEKNYADPNGKTVLEIVVTAALGHDTENADSKVATCLKSAYCARCESEYGEPLGHLEITVDAIPAECEKDGWTEGKYCERCCGSNEDDRVWIVEPEKIDATGHDVDFSTEGSTAATCKKQAYCADCGSYYGEALPHDIKTIPAVAPTCSAVGSEAYSKCKNCDYVSVDKADENENGVYDAIEIAALNHNGTTLTYTEVEEVPAKCEEKGTQAHYVCSCGAKVQKNDQDVYVAVTDAELEIAALEHDPNATVVEGGREPDCELTGICGLCGEEYADALGHDYVVEGTNPATCVNGGVSAKVTCSRCDYEDGGEEIPADGHNLTYTAAVAPTCTESGMFAYWYCADCNSYFASTADANDADALEAEKAALLYEATADYVVDAENEIDERVVNATNHDNGNALIAVEGKANTCTENGYEAYVYCTLCDYTTYKVIPAAHTDVQEYAEDPASCYEDGLTAGKKCEDCGEVLEGLVVIPATNHAGTIIVKDVKVPATCISVGYTEGIFCTACNEYVARPQEIAMIEHAITKHDAVEKSCTVEGFIEYYTCANECCANTYYVIEDNAYVATTTVSLGYAAHTLELINAQAATCTANGWTKYKVCEDCGHYFNLNGVEIEAIPYIDALGHKFGDVIESDPTCTEVGYNKHKVCSVCEVAFKAYATLYAGLEHAYAEGAEVIPATGHTVQLQTKTLAVDCATPGHEAYYLCACGAKFIDNDVDATEFAERYTEIDDTYYNENIVIKAAHLNVKPVGVLAATCVEGGYAAHLFCYTCNNVVVEANGEYVVSELVKYEAIGHTFGAIDSLAPTCAETGRLNNVTCTVCSSVYVIENNKEAKDYAWSAIVEYTEEEVAELVKIDAVGHTWATFVAVDPTCTVEGYKAFRVCACNAIADTNEDGVWELISSLPVDATDAHVHCDTIEVYDDATSKYVAVASFEDVKIEATGHLNVIIAPKKDATCTEIGYEQAKVCADCDTILEASETIPAKGHKFEVNIGTKATCEEDGVWAYAYCTVCMVTEGAANGTETEYGFKVLLPKATYADVVAAEAALDTIMERVEYTTENEADKIVIPAFGHGTAQSIVEVQEDCFTTGYEAFTTCGMYVYSVVKVYVGDDAKTGEPLYSYVLKATLAEDVNLDAYEVCNTVFVGEKAYALTAITDTLYDVDAEAIEVEEGETYFEIPEELVIARLAHEWTAKVEEKLADCENYGWKEADVCIHCQKTGDIVKIDPRPEGHVLELVEEVIEVCVDDEGKNHVGSKAYFVCTNEKVEGQYAACGKMFQAVWNEEKGKYEVGAEITDKDWIKVDTQDGHKWELVAAKPATCTEAGWNEFYACACGLSFRKIDADFFKTLMMESGHVEGHIHCGSFAKDAEGTPITWEEIYVAPLGHDWTYVEGEDTITTKPTCTTTGVASGACKNDCGETSDEIIVPVVNEGKDAHTWGRTNFVAATCTEDGYETYICTACKLANKKITPADDYEAFFAEFLEGSALEEKIAYFEETIRSNGHAWGDMVENRTVPSCTEESMYDHQICSVCEARKIYTEEKPEGFVVSKEDFIANDSVVIRPAYGHHYEFNPAKAATCTTPGWNAYYACACMELRVVGSMVLPYDTIGCTHLVHCGSLLAAVADETAENGYAQGAATTLDDIIITVAEHIAANVVATPANDPDCVNKENGNTAYWYCKACETYYSDAECKTVITVDANGDGKIDATDMEIDWYYGHSFRDTTDADEGHEVVASKCYEYGSKTQICDKCDTIQKVALPYAEHKYVYVQAKEATCNVDGNVAYWYCEVAECTYSKANVEAGKTDQGVVIIPNPGNHVYNVPELVGTATCNKPGFVAGTGVVYYCKNCGELDPIYEDKKTATLDHKNAEGELQLKSVAATPATCQATGIVAHYECELCGDKFADDQAQTKLESVVDPIKDHTLVKQDAKATSCEAAGYREHYKCTNVIGQDADGKDIVCGLMFADAEGKTPVTASDIAIEALPHVTITIAAKEATCTEIGWTAYEQCKFCTYSTQAENIIDALGHVIKITVTKPATANENGICKVECTRCNTVLDEELEYWLDDGTCIHEDLAHVAEKFETEVDCTEEYNVEHWYCADCNNYFLDAGATQVVDRSSVYTTKNHVWKVVAGVEQKATCEKAGECEKCGVVNAYGHNYVEDTDAKQDATCTTNGSHYYECDRDCCASGECDCVNSTKTTPIIAPGHIDNQNNEDEADKTPDGKCDYCSKEME